MAGSPVRLATVLAHQGGWDEMLLVAGPIVVIVALLALVKRRVDAAADAAAVADTTVADTTPAHDEPGPIRDGR